MTKLKEEVLQLENNIEFFAKSKGPNLIKQEYEKKIQDSKDEIAKLKERLKEIRSAQ
jgi:predicted peroxiredoxin